VTIEFRILGSVEARAGGSRLDLGGPRQRSVLAVLLLHTGQVVPVSALIDAVWGGEPPETAVNLLQGYVSDLRKALGRDVIATRGRGYAMEVEPSAVDLHRFEQLVAEAGAGAPEVAVDRLRSALALWRGPPFADLAEEPFARAAAPRLEELRLAALERRIEADLAVGRDAQLVGELEQIAREHPLREHPRELLMLALYRCGRQAEALDVYRAARRALVDQLGIEPGRALRELEQAILRQDPGLDAPHPRPSAEARRDRSILVVPGDDAGIIRLVSIAEPLARTPRRELIVLRLLAPGAEPAPTTARLAALRDGLVGRGAQLRVAAFTSAHRGEDAVLLATEQDADLLLVDATPGMLDGRQPDADLDAIVRDAPCDVAILLTGRAVHGDPAQPVVVPFGGQEHDWSAVELARRCASWAPRPIDCAAGVTRAAYWAARRCSFRRWRASWWSRRWSAEAPRGCSRRPPTRRCSSWECRAAGRTRGSAPRGSRWLRGRACRCCWSGAGCVPAGSRRRRA
jgi:DNA-binding SARP family transcriptional activator